MKSFRIFLARSFLFMIRDTIHDKKIFEKFVAKKSKYHYIHATCNLHIPEINFTFWVLELFVASEHVQNKFSAENFPYFHLVHFWKKIYFLEGWKLTFHVEINFHSLKNYFAENKCFILIF